LRQRASPIEISLRLFVNGEIFGRGKGNTKKAARDEAAKQGLARIGLNIVWWVFQLLFCTLIIVLVR
jgi:ribonuclease-3